MALLTAASSHLVGLPWWHVPLVFCAWFLGGIMTLCAVHWPRSPTPGIDFMQDIVIPLGFTLLACAGIVGGCALLSTR
jgi:hypothetical protein